MLRFDREGERIILRYMEMTEKDKEALLARLGARVRALRLGAGLTVGEFADRASLLRSAFRNAFVQTNDFNEHGFRAARTFATQ